MDDQLTARPPRPGLALRRRRPPSTPSAASSTAPPTPPTGPSPPASSRTSSSTTAPPSPRRRRPRRPPRARRRMGPAFATGPGVIVIAGAYPDPAPIDRATDLFTRIIEDQHRAGTGGGDHFAKPGANDRIWNALEKHCLADPEGFALYYGNEAIALASESWLGPGYQMTAQVNRVNPGGAAQTAHRDYHLGFMSPEEAAALPRPRPPPLPALTLQGAVAHGDMPLETGPTLLLPYSQLFLGRLPRLRARPLPGLVPRPPRPAPARQGRPPLLQPRAHARRRHQPHRRPLPHGQPPAGLLRLRPRHGGHRPHPHDARPLPRPRPPPRRRPPHRRRRPTTPSPPPPKATPSPPTSTPTRPSAASPRRSQADLTREALRAGTAPEAFATHAPRPRRPPAALTPRACSVPRPRLRFAPNPRISAWPRSPSAARRSRDRRCSSGCATTS